MNRVDQPSSRPSHVQERLIGALIPDALGPRDRVTRLPLPVLPILNRLDSLDPAALLVSTSRMDRSGRIHKRILLRQLGWHPSTRMDIDTLHNLIVIAANPTGHHTIDHRGAIKLPASLRRLRGIDHGPPLVLAAAMSEQVMVVHPSATITHLLTTHYTHIIQTEYPAPLPDRETESPETPSLPVPTNSPPHAWHSPNSA